VRRTGAGPAVQMSKGTSSKEFKFYNFYMKLKPGTKRRTHSFVVIDMNSA
jgi:hypothetical protein